MHAVFVDSLPSLSRNRLLFLSLVCVCLVAGQAKAQSALAADESETDRAASVITTVPFKVRPDGQIFVRAYLGYKKVLAELDTGTLFTSFPKWMNIPTIGKPRRTTSEDCFGTLIEEEKVTLPSIRIGDFKVENVVADQTLAPSDLGKTMNDDSFLDHVFLGTNVFKDVILTIDYARGTLTLRKPQFDMSKGRLAPGTMILPFTNRPGDYKADYYRPLIRCIIDGIPMATSIDTGLLTDGILLWKNGRDKLTRKDYTLSKFTTIRPGSLTAEAITIDRLDNVWLRFEGYPRTSLRSSALCTPEEGIEEDAVIGYPVLRNYLVTIDYPHNRLILEPNPSLVDVSMTINGKKISATVPFGSTVSVTVSADGSIRVDPSNATVETQPKP